MIITNSTTDSFYLDQLLAFLSSIRANSSSSKVLISLVNTNNEIYDRLKTVFSEFIFEQCSIDMVDTRGFSLIILRANMLRDCFSKYREPISWIDTDTLIRKDLSEFIKVSSNELKILIRNHDPNVLYSAPINAGVFSIGCSDATKNLVNDWYKDCVANPKWGYGQIALWKAYSKRRNEIKLTGLSKSYNDMGSSDKLDVFNKNSIIWHCKKKHFNNPKFQKEFQYYLRLGKEYMNE